MSPKLRSFFSPLAIALALGSGSAWAQPASEPDANEADDAAKEEASERFRRGVELYNAGDYRAALIEFRRANEIAPNYRVLFNLGQASFELKDYVSAKRSFERYLEEGGDEVSEERRAAVQAELDKLEGYVAELELTVDVDGAEIAVDDLVVGETPLDEPLLVSAGRRKIGLTRRGYAPLDRYVDVAGGETKRLALEMTPLGGPAEPRASGASPEPDAPPPESSNTAFWVSLGAAGLFAAGTAVFGVLALGAKNDYDDALDSFPTTQEEIESARSDVTTFSVTADVMGGLTLFATTLAIVFAVSGSDDSASAKAPGPSVWITAGPASAGLRGRF